MFKSKRFYTQFISRAYFLLLFTIVTSLICVGGGRERALASNIGEHKELIPRVSSNVVYFNSMREPSSSVYNVYKYHSTSGGKLILIEVKTNTLWRSISSRCAFVYIISHSGEGIGYALEQIEYNYLESISSSLVVTKDTDINRVQPIQFEFIGYEKRGASIRYKANQTISLKFNEKNLEQFNATLNSLAAGISFPIKIHKKHVGRLIVRKSNKNVLYLEKDLSDNSNIVDIVINSKPDYVEQEISVVPLINTSEYLTRLGGKSSISKTLISN